MAPAYLHEIPRSAGESVDRRADALVVKLKLEFASVPRILVSLCLWHIVDES